VGVIEDKLQKKEFARELVGRAGKSGKGAVRGCPPALVEGILAILAACLMFSANPAVASNTDVPLKSIAQITMDDDGRHLSYPLAVFYDPIEDEIYAVNGGNFRVVVYGPDFFPRVSIGKGRGVLAARGGIVMPNGEVYICQVRPSPRITILNGAFFVEREILLDQISEAPGFLPNQVALSHDGTIYVAGINYRGVLVLDHEGNFLRLLQPEDEINIFGNEQEKNQPGKEEKPTEEKPTTSGEGQEVTPEDFYANIPEEFRPRSMDDKSGLRRGRGPVKINFVIIDQAGRLYLLSGETGKIYVYGPDEVFLFSFGKKGGSPRQLSTPKGLAIDEQRKLIYVVDYMRHTILAYHTENGKFAFEVGGRGLAPCWFNFPVGIAINTKGDLIVADQFNKRVQVIEVEQARYGDELISPASDESIDASPESPDADEEVAPDETAASVETAVPEQATAPAETSAPDENAAAPPAAAPEKPVQIPPDEKTILTPIAVVPEDALPDEKESTGIPVDEKTAPQQAAPIVEEVLRGN
jgi:DNA-binding beta-propeller fold protein YncE